MKGRTCATRGCASESKQDSRSPYCLKCWVNRKAERDRRNSAKYRAESGRAVRDDVGARVDQETVDLVLRHALLLAVAAASVREQLALPTGVDVDREDVLRLVVEADDLLQVLSVPFAVDLLG